MRRVSLACLLSLVVCGAGWAQVAPAGGEFQVNTYTTGEQIFPAVAVDGNGDFVVAWTSVGQDGDGSGIRWRRFDSAGVSQSAGAANVYTTGFQTSPVVAAGPGGDFIVAWETDAPEDGDGTGVFARRFDASGTPVGGEFRVNGHTAGNQFGPSVALAPNGTFVVVWTSDGQDGSGDGVFARLFDSDGNPMKGFQVNTYTTGSQLRPKVAMDGFGRFVVVWTGMGANDDAGVFARRFDASGTPAGGQFLVTSDTTATMSSAAVAMDRLGNFVVVWNVQGATNFDVLGRRFDSAGNPQGGDLQLNAWTTGGQFNPSVAADGKGNFVVTWASYAEDGDGYGIVGRTLDPAGSLGDEFVVNEYTTGRQYPSRVASSPDGDFVVAWESDGEDGDGYGVFARRYGDLIFEDNFESGGIGRWTTTATDGGNLSVTAGAAMAGTFQGLRALVNDTNSLFVQDDSPAAEVRYRVRFYFDPGNFDPGEALNHLRIRMFLAQDAANLRVVTVVLRRKANQYSVEARARQNDGTRIDTGFFDITDAPHFVEFDWQRASGPGAHDGSLTFYVDDTPMTTLTALDNDQMVVESGKLGALSLKDGCSGTLHFDQFESRRLRAIGPE